MDEILKVSTVNELITADPAVKRCVEISKEDIEFAVSATVLTRCAAIIPVVSVNTSEPVV